MGRSTNAEPSSGPLPPPELATTQGVGPGLAWLGWTLAALGALVGVGAGEGWVPTVGWGSAGLGLVLVVAGLVRTGRAALTATNALFTVGAVVLLGGAAALVYPCFITRQDLAALHETASFVPALAVAAVALGATLLVVGLNRQRSSEAPFALEVGERAVVWWRELDPRRFFLETWKEIDREAAEERAQRAAAGQTGYDWRPIVVFSAGAVCLGLMEYLGHGSPPMNAVLSLDGLFRQLGPGAPEGSVWYAMQRSSFRGLSDFVWWSGWRVLGFFLLPALVVKLVLRGRLSDYGLSTAGFLRHAWIYVVFFAIVLIAVVVVSYDPHFAAYYPFYKQASRSWYDFWAWELLYAAQFFSLEFFFRGFWLKAAKTAMGSHAIYAMVVPYCMIHFGKPFLETLAAILAGIVLGTLAMRTRSIWSGFLIHVSVAISMDLAVLIQTDALPTRWWPPV
jgi:membrane protease YdiL (CAAX protease family)